MDTTATCTGHSITGRRLYLALELSNSKWKLGFTVGMGQDPRQRTIEAGDTRALRQEIAQAKQRFSLGPDCPVVSCYEAGRDGFWLHRYLTQEGIENQVVDSSSIEVNRRARRAKTDRIDLGKLLAMLIRYHEGERSVWRTVRVPTVAQEDRRQLHRELTTLKQARTQHSNRIQGLLVSQGVRLRVTPEFPQQLAEARTWDGSPIAPGLQDRLLREFEQWSFIQAQIRALEAQRRELIRTSDDPDIVMVRQLLKLRGIGVNSAWVFVMEVFGWREIKNRRQVGALFGLAPTPYASGSSAREQGISKAGNPLARTMAIEIAWGWLRYQPDSELTLWYQERYGHGNKRQRRVGIVALARKLVVALWRYLTTGLVPTGAILKAA